MFMPVLRIKWDNISKAHSTKPGRQACLEDIVGLVQDYHSKASITITGDKEFLDFPVHVKVMFALYYDLLGV